MKKILLAFTMMAVGTVSASAGPIYDLGYHTSSATMKLSGDIRIAASSSSANSPTITLSGPSGITTSKSIATASSVSANAGFYGSGLNLTEVIHSTAALQAQLSSVAASTGVLTTDLATEVSNRMIADTALSVSTGALESSKVNRTGDTMTGQLNGTSSVFSASVTAASMTVTGRIGAGGNISTAGQIISSGTGNNYFAGKVGIGLSAPNNMLMIAPPGITGGLTIRESDNGQNAVVLNANSDGGTLSLLYAGTPVINLPFFGDSYINSGGTARLGLGTTTPDQKLTVAGNISQTGVIISSGTGNNYFAGKVGIGVTPSVALDVLGTHVSGVGVARFKGDGANGFATLDTTTGGGTAGFLVSLAGVKKAQFDYTGTDGTRIYNTVADATYPKLRANDAGNVLLAEHSGSVGIGTTAPSAKLEVAGTVQVSSATLNVSGTGAGITTTGDVTATAFHGNGAALTGLPGGGDAVLAATQTWTGSNTFAGTTSTTTFSGWVDIGYELVTTSGSGTLTAVCPAGKVALYCGGTCSNGVMYQSYISDYATTRKTCTTQCQSGGSIAQASCIRAK